jgi:hypothetical protein
MKPTISCVAPPKIMPYPRTVLVKVGPAHLVSMNMSMHVLRSIVPPSYNCVDRAEGDRTWQDGQHYSRHAEADEPERCRVCADAVWAGFFDHVRRHGFFLERCHDGPAQGHQRIRVLVRGVSAIYVDQAQHGVSNDDDKT